jgi:nucleoside-diphosphate-sugar epimerase
MSLPSFHLVIAKYKENISWISAFNEKNLFIYDKSPNPIEGSLPRMNIGREVESFFYHIIKHYNNLPDYLVFVQGNPFDHFHDVTKETFESELTKLLSSKPEISAPLFTNIHVEPVNTYPGLLVSDYYEYTFNRKSPEKLGFAAGCQYIIPKADILKKSLQFYKAFHYLILRTNILTSEDAHNTIRVFDPNSICGWTVERLLYGILLASDYNRGFDKKRYLVTGGAGFIGSNLVDLLKEDANVVVLDNLTTGNLQYVPQHKNVFFVKEDILHNNLYQCVGFVDGIFHMAAMSKVLPSLEDPTMIEFCQRQNVDGTINILKYAQGQSPPVKVVYSASSTYYGNNPTPQKEDQLPDCQTPYALTKYMGELYCNLYSTLYNVPTVRLRYFMVYGPREPSTGAYAVVSGIFLQRKKQNLPLIIHGDGTQSRDFVHVHDICKANILAMNNTSLVDETINVGTGTTLSIKALADLISDNQIFTEKRKVDLKATLCETTKLQDKLGWVPTNRIQDYIQEKLQTLQ